MILELALRARDFHGPWDGLSRPLADSGDSVSSGVRARGIVSPTDPIAVSAISARVPIPKRVLHVLEGESL